MNQSDLQEYLDFAKKLANQAGEIMLKYYRINQQIEIKSDDSPVTIADTLINDLVITTVQAKYPDHGVLGEEASWQTEKEYLWVCDPIDGTKAYIQHIPNAMFSLALVVNGESIVAITFNPFTGDKYTALKGGGAYLNQVPIAVSQRSWGDAIIVRSGAPSARSPLEAELVAVGVETAGNHIISLYGASVARGSMIAEGSADGMIWMGKGAHDIAALKLIVEEAGGRVTDITGNDQKYNQSLNGAIISNGKIHKELLEIVNQNANTRN